MDSADARAGQHGDGGFRHHRHIDSNDIAFFNAQIEQYVGKTANIAMELAISDVFALAGVIAFPDDRGLVAALVQMAVETVTARFRVPSSYHLMEMFPGAKEVFLPAYRA